MALTAAVKQELCQIPVTTSSERAAEAVAMLRFAGGIHLISGRIVVETELDRHEAAQRLCQTIQGLYGHQTEVIRVSGQNLRHGDRYVIRVLAGGAELARQTGLVDPRGRPVRGMPPAIVNGSTADAAATWRGAFLAHGSLTEPGRSSALEVTAPGPEAALAMVGAARRLGVMAKAREVRQSDRVVIRDGDAIADLLTAMGATETVKVWQERRTRKEVRASANRLANFDDANLRRSAQAAVAAGARVARALEILEDDVPEHLEYAGRLRIEHQHASLDELGRLAEPQMTKDAIAGRIRRLLAMADKRAAEENIPNTHDAVPEELREDD
ncbi:MULTISPECIES: DNA-binding protein WhiA [Auritidibacter]|uniref:DNA-binding protein WhiA n=1 Tax=Auritidibacter TaxID=1160973 RepID=UPI000D7392E7|nr:MULTISPECIES: DNA-binding protein WhiA [Auritidibacter]PXA77756.1 DNA-binding protein WhiA [Auritidibacter sp. NML100628]WHS34884.1 DNA-binding protein WhiA [Auritidibacter ignavus]